MSNLGSALISLLLDPITTKLAGINLSQGIPINNYGIIAGLSTSAYFQGTFKFTDWFNLTRWARPATNALHKDLEGSRTEIGLAGGGSIPLFQNSVPKLHANQFSPRVACSFCRLTRKRSSTLPGHAATRRRPTTRSTCWASSSGPIKPVLQQKKNDAYESGRENRTVRPAPCA